MSLRNIVNLHGAITYAKDRIRSKSDNYWNKFTSSFLEKYNSIACLIYLSPSPRYTDVTIHTYSTKIETLGPTS